MAAHIETGTMVDPRYESRHLGHLGVMARKQAPLWDHIRCNYPVPRHSGVRQQPSAWPP